MVIVETYVGELDCGELLYLGPNLHDDIVGMCQVSNYDPAFEINRGQQIRIILQTAEGRSDLFFVIVNDLRLWLLLLPKSDLPKFNCLVSRSRD